MREEEDQDAFKTFPHSAYEDGDGQHREEGVPCPKSRTTGFYLSKGTVA